MIGIKYHNHFFNDFLMTFSKFKNRNVIIVINFLVRGKFEFNNINLRTLMLHNTLGLYPLEDSHKNCSLYKSIYVLENVRCCVLLGFPVSWCDKLYTLVEFLKRKKIRSYKSIAFINDAKFSARFVNLSVYLIEYFITNETLFT